MAAGSRMFLSGLGLALAAPAFAQEPPADKEIVVTGEAEEVDHAEVTRQARELSRDTDVRHTPLARFEDPACPGVIGLKVDFAEQVVGRMRWIAEDYDIPLADEATCKPNILVVFTEDGRADLADIQRRTRFISASVSVDERKELIEEPGPVRAWSIVQSRMANGMPAPEKRDLSDLSSMDSMSSKVPTSRQEGGQSRITTASRNDIVGVIVLFDRNAVRGKSLHQLADYAIMRVYARTRDAAGEQAPDTILGLFDAGNLAPPDGLTEFDRAYLAALYEGVPQMRGISKLQRVGRQLEKLREAKE